MNVDPAAVNTVLLALFGVGGSVLIFRYIGPILSTQEKHRVSQDKEIAALRVEMDAAATERELLKGMVTQRAQVDDLRQFTKVAADESARRQRDAMGVMEKHDRESADQHQQQILVMREMVATLRGIEYRLGVAPDRRAEAREDERDIRADKREDRRDDREDRRDAREEEK